MAGRVGTVYGTGGADFIDPDYVDAEGNSIFKFEDDNGYTWWPDVIHIWAGDGDDTIRFYDRGVNLHPTYVDQLIIHAGAGNDNISFQGNWYSWNPRAPIGVNAGEGDDVVTVQTPGHTSPPWITLGTGSDELRVSSFDNEIGVVMVTDYAPGEDRLGRVSEVVEIVWRRNLRVNQHPPNRRRQPPGRSRHEAEYRQLVLFATARRRRV